MLRANDAALAHTNVFGKNYTAGSIYDLMCKLFMHDNVHRNSLQIIWKFFYK